MTQETEIYLKVNDSAALQKFDELEEKAKKLRERFQQAFETKDHRAMASISKDLERTNNQMRQMRLNAGNIRETMQRLDQATPKELKRVIADINKELNSGRVQRGSKEWQEYCQQLKRAKAELRHLNDGLAEQPGLFARIKSSIGSWQTSLIAGLGAITGLGISAKQAIEDYASMQQEEANVRKYTGMTAEDVSKLNDAFKQMDTRTTREQLNVLAQEAGRLGKTSVEDVLGFVRAADQINVALDDLGEGATLTLSKLTGVFGVEAALGTERSLLAVGSVINELSQNCAASAPYLTEFASRLGGVGNQAGMSVQQIMGFASVLDANNQSLERSATALSNFITHLYVDPEKYAKAVGINVKEFTDLLNKDANAAIIRFLEEANKLGGMEALAPLFADLKEKGSGMVATLSSLAANIEMVKDQQNAANTAFDEATSIGNEFAVQNATVQAQLDKSKKGFQELSIELGEKLLPVMRYSVSALSTLVSMIITVIDFVNKYRGTLITLCSALTAYQIAANLAAIKTKLLTVWMGISKGLTTSLTLATHLYSAAMALLTGNTVAATASLKAFSTALKMSPIGLAVAAITAAVVGFVMLTKRTSDAEKAQRALAQAEKDAAVNARRELAETDALYKKTQDVNASMHTRLAAAEQLKKMHKDTFANLSAEAIVAGQAAQAYQLLADNITKTALATAYRDKLANNATALAEAEIARNDLLDALKKSPSVGALVGDDPEESIKRLKEWVAARDQSHADVFAYRPGGTTSTAENLRNQIMRLERLQSSIDTYNATASTLADKITNIESSISTPEATSTPATDTPGHTPTESESEMKKRERERQQRMKAELDEQKSLLEKEEALNLLNYVTGEKNYEQYIAKKRAIDMGLIDNQLAVLEEYGETESKAYADLLLKKSQLQKNWADEDRQRTLAELKDEYEERKKIAYDLYADQNSTLYMNDQALKQILFEEEVAYLKKQLELYKDNAEERVKVERQLNKTVQDDQLAKARETKEKREAFEKEYMTDKLTAYKESLKKIDELEKEGIISSEEATKARLEELSKYLDSIGQDFSSALVKLLEEIYEAMSGMGGGIEDIIIASLGVMTAALSQYTTYMNAERDLELAKIEDRYDKEIEAAGKNTKKKEQLEKEKEAEVAKTKKKYNDRAMKIEIAQALAQTAQGAIAAYASAAAIPAIGWILAPTAAALAVAAGMMQVAAIKKQHQAEALGYYEGGFTGGKNYRNEAGVVHEGEFVANHNAVNNPQLSNLFLLLDYAQRNNTVGSLTARDVSNALGQGSGVSARGEIAATSSPVIVTNQIDTTSLDNLNAILERGIDARVTIAGEDGLDKKYREFNKLINNPKR